MFDFVPKRAELVHPRLLAPLPLELLSPTVQAACAAELAEFVTAEATRLKQQLGFGWNTAPISIDFLDHPRAAYRHSLQTKTDLSVSIVSIHRTIYGQSSAAKAARYWHAVSLSKFQSHNVAPELSLDLMIVDYAATRRVSREACWYLEADLLGHTMLRGLGFQHPRDSRTFTIDHLTFGLADAVVLEAQRQHDALARHYKPRH